MRLWRFGLLVVVLVGAVVALSGCEVLELLVTGTTSNIESSRGYAAAMQAAQVEAEGHAFALAQAEITSRQHNSEMFYLAYNQQLLEHSAREAQRIDAVVGKSETPQVKPWVPVAAGGLGLILGGMLIFWFMRKTQGGY
jgi:hypothetical protein